MKRLSPTLIALLAFLWGMPMAHPAETVRCTVMTIQASNTGQGIDQKLQGYTSILKQPPFSKFDTFQLVKDDTYRVSLNAPTTLRLPKSLTGSLRLNSQQKDQLNLNLTLARNGQRPIEIKGRAHPGSPFFAAGFTNPGGIWIFGVACNQNEIATH